MTKRGLLLLLMTIAGCGHKIDGPQPQVSAVTPEAACNDQIATAIAISGQSLSPLFDNNLNASQLELPQITLMRVVDLDNNPQSDVIAVPNDPKNPAAGDEQWTSQQAMAFTLCPPGICSTMTPPLTDYTALPPGLYTVAAQNRNGKSATLDRALTIVPIPVLNATQPDLLCEDKDCTATLTGDYFIRINGTPSTVTVGDKSFTPSSLDGCRQLPSAQDVTIEACTSATFTIPAGTFMQGTYPVSVVGPTSVGCHSVQAATPVTITFVRAPKLTSAVPDIACDAQGDRTITLEGADFLSVNGVLPTVHIGSQSFTPTSIGGCVPITGPGLSETVQQCTTMTVLVPQAALPAMNYPVSVTNPPPADCTTTPTVDLTIVPPPALTAIQPDLACDAEMAQKFTLTGSGFLFITPTAGTTAGPTVVITQGASSVTSIAATPTAGACSALAGPVEGVQSCTAIDVLVPQGTLAGGSYGFTVTNPDPAGCTTTTTMSALIVPPPAIANVQPSAICNVATGSSTILVNGSGFLFVDGVGPSVDLTQAGGTAMTHIGPTGVTAAGTCLVLSGPTSTPPTTETVKSCTAITVAIPSGAVTGTNTYDLVVTNPPPASCVSTQTVTLTGAPPPTISGVSSALCSGGGTITIQGTNLSSSTSVILTPAGASSPVFVATSVVPSGTCTGSGATLECDTATAFFGVVPAGNYNVTINVGGQCSSTFSTAIAVTSGPLAFYASPAVVYNGINTSETVFVANLNGATITGVKFYPSGTNPANAPASTTFTGAQINTSKPGRGIVTLPSGMAPGSWDVLVTTSSSCSTTVLANAISVVSTVTANLIKSMTPNVGYVGDDVPVTIIVNQPLDTIPQLYLSNASSASATALSAVSLLSSTSISAIVPKSSLVAGQTYDLILTGASGGATVVGLLQNAYTANANPTPEIASVSPESVPTSTSVAVKVLGSNFASPGAALTLQCFDSTGASVTAPTFSSGPTVVSPTEIDFSATFSSTQALCNVTVTNPDKSSFTWSAIVVQNPAQKLGLFAASSPLATGRRALGAAAARANASTRFLYAVGGDSGVESGALASVDVAPLDIYGKLGSFVTLPSADRVSGGKPVGPSLALQAAHTYTSAVAIGHWLYAVGGSNGTSASTDVERAYVLDPLAVDNIADVDINLDTTAGVPGGTWIYRVAPVMRSPDAYNPGGEMLAGEPFTIVLPTLQSGALDVVIKFPAFANAARYNVYRTPDQSHLGANDVVFIGSVADIGAGSYAFTDTGAPLPTPAVHPLPLGATSVWQTTAPSSAFGAAVSLALQHARAGSGVTVVRDSAVSISGKSVWYLYALAGNSGNETTVSIDDSYEWLTIIEDLIDHTESVSGFTLGATIETSGAGGFKTPRGKWQADAFPGTPDTIPYDTSAAYVYYASGLRSTAASGMFDGTLLYATVALGSGTTPNGSLGTAWTQANSAGFGNEAGYAGTFVNGFAYGFGGQLLGQATPIGAGIQSQNQTTTTTTTPLMSNPSASSSITPRDLSAAVTASGYVFVLGGSSSITPMAGAALSTDETTIY